MSEGPVFVAGRQHSGNTMLATILGNASEVLALQGEGQFYERAATTFEGDVDDRAQAILNLVEDSADRPVLDGHRSTILDHVRKEIRPIPQTLAGSAEIYRTCMDVLAREHGADRWVQKATSYVFHIEDILQSLPDAKVVYLLRNPLDLAASVKRRIGRSGLLRMVWGWNTGLSTAETHASSEPDRVRIVRYEDLVTESEATVSDLCDWAGLPFTDAMLEIPTVNPSEAKYETTGETARPNSDRVGYHEQVLTDGERRAVRRLADAGHLQRRYPDLASEEPLREAAIPMADVVLRGTTHLALDQARQLLEDPVHAYRRLTRRLAS